MLKIAQNEDLVKCQNLLGNLNPNLNNISSTALHLKSYKNGFTLLIEKNNKAIAISTFTIRKKKIDNIYLKMLYWENLYVEKSERNGLAYIQMLSFIKKRLQTKDFNDLYFIVRRKSVSKLHKIFKFKTIGFMMLRVKNIKFHLGSYLNHKNLRTLPYSKFKYFWKSLSNQDKKKYLENFMPYTKWNMYTILRQINNKKGFFIINDCEYKIQFISTYFQKWYVSINICLENSNQSDLMHNSLLTFQKGIVINLYLLKLIRKPNLFIKLTSLANYEIMSYLGTIKSKFFYPFEHDAW